MEFDNSFEVPLPPDEAWKVLLDVERIAPCMPGAELTELIDPETFKGKVSVRLGPVALTFAGDAKFVDIDAAQHKASVKAQGRDSKGRGGAAATVNFHLEPVPAGSKVMVHTDLTLSGAVAQYGRGAGMIQDLAGQLIRQFATSLQGQLAVRPIAPVSAPAAAAAPAAGMAAAGMETPREEIAAPPPRPPPRTMPPPAKPISGFSLMARVLWNALLRLFSGRQRPS